ncbi:MAG: copper ion binding protein, partial [Acholeplasmataceae bacterium]
MKTLKFRIHGMTCTSCAARIDDVLNDTEGIIAARINPVSDLLHVDVDEARIDAPRIERIIQSIGYDATSLSAQTVTKTFSVTGMTCQMCATHVTKRVSELGGVRDVNVNLATDQLRV